MKPESYEEIIVFCKKLGLPHDKVWKAIKDQLLPFDKRVQWKIERFRMYAEVSVSEITPILKELDEGKIKCKTLKDLKKKFPARTKRIRKTIETSKYLNRLKHYYPNENLDTEDKKRKEVENLEKLIASKKQDFWFNPNILSTNPKDWNSPAAIRVYNLIR